MKPEELIRQATNLPLVSQAALKLIGLLDQPFVSNEEVVHVLKYDTVLTAKLLQACNSSYFGFSEPIFSVDQAVLVLGHKQTLQLVLSLTFGGAMSTPLPGYSAEAKELWSHALYTALAAEVVARAEPSLAVDPPVVFTAGLLHDIGKLVLNHVLTQQVQTRIRCGVSQAGLARNEAEKEVLGTDHAEVGACLLEKWKLPGDIVEAVANHHAPISKPRPQLSVLIHTANCLSHLVGSTLGWEGFAVRTDAGAIESLSITPATLEEMMVDVHDSARKVEEFMALS